MEKKRCWKAVISQVKSDNKRDSLSSSFRKVLVRNMGERKYHLSAPLYSAQKHCGMTNGAVGFTLIELLVVVLIIGILAAVAVPQYQKAVEKSRAREALSLLKSVYQAAKAYEMANGAWPESFDELAVEIPWTGNVRWRESSYIRDTRSNDLWSLQLYKNRGDEQVLLGRISGKYEGVGFGINSGGAWSCVEKTAKGKVFSGKTGDYCVKIMRTGTTYTTYSSGRYYSYQP